MENCGSSETITSRAPTLTTSEVSLETFASWAGVASFLRYSL